jgi:gliding motility-associated-like protein
MKKNCFIFLLLVLGMAYGQDETTNWYFGRGAGLQFNSDGSVTPLTDGKTNTEEGCASISDRSGNLLFYTDGITVFNRSHDIMLNGTGLYGDPSSTQSALIVPDPVDSNIFFIFTVDTSIREGDPDNGLSYSIVDISQNGGNGQVMTRNVNLLRSCSEKITAVVKDCVDKSIWVVTLSTLDGSPGLSDTFHAFEVNDQGVDPTSVKSTFENKFGDQRGYLKLSSDGKKMASANEFDGLFLYDFDAELGVVSNPEEIIIDALNKNPYSVEFSPSNQYLYVHTHSDSPAVEIGHSSNLLQYDLLSPIISKSEEILDQSNNYRGALQLGANGRIYRTITETYLNGTQYLGVINDPDRKGAAANYVHNAIFLEGGIAMQGLPPFIQSFFAKKGLIANADGSTSTSATICDGTELVLEADNLPGATYEWEHDGEPFNNPGNHILRIDEIGQDDVGQYRLVITPADASECAILGEAQIQVTRPPLANNTSLLQCDIDEGSATASSDGFTVFNLEQVQSEISPSSANTVTFYESLTDQANDNPIDSPQQYLNKGAGGQTLYVTVEDANGCTNEAELTLEIRDSSQDLSTGESFYACSTEANGDVLEGIFDLEIIRNQNYSGLEVAFYLSRTDAALETNPILENNYSSISTNIFARIESMNQCLGVEEFDLVVNPTPIVNIDSEFMLCTNDPDLQIMAEDGFDSYAWFKMTNGGSEQLVSNEREVDIMDPGEYRLEVGWSYNGGEEVCTNSRGFSIVPSSSATITNIEIEDLQENNHVTILAMGEGDYEYAIGDVAGPYQDDPVLQNVPPGIATVFVRDKNGCGITEEEISVIGFPKFFTPNGDGVNESWNLIGVSDDMDVAVTIYDRYGKLLYRVSPDDPFGWNGTFNGKSLPASDYWFRIRLKEGRVYKGHFTLKR